MIKRSRGDLAMAAQLREQGKEWPLLTRKKLPWQTRYRRRARGESVAVHCAAGMRKRGHEST